MSSFTDDPPGCPVCDGPGEYQGRRSSRDWWACRCGMWFDTPAEDNEDPPGDDWDGCDEW